MNFKYLIKRRMGAIGEVLVIIMAVLMTFTFRPYGYGLLAGIVVVYCYVGFLDLYTTKVGLKQGLVEMNPIIQLLKHKTAKTIIVFLTICKVDFLLLGILISSMYYTVGLMLLSLVVGATLVIIWHNSLEIIRSFLNPILPTSQTIKAQKRLKKEEERTEELIKVIA